MTGLGGGNIFAHFETHTKAKRLHIHHHKHMRRRTKASDSEEEESEESLLASRSSSDVEEDDDLGEEVFRPRARSAHQEDDSEEYEEEEEEESSDFRSQSDSEVSEEVDEEEFSEDVSEEDQKRPLPPQRGYAASRERQQSPKQPIQSNETKGEQEKKGPGVFQKSLQTVKKNLGQAKPADTQSIQSPPCLVKTSTSRARPKTKPIFQYRPKQPLAHQEESVTVPEPFKNSTPSSKDLKDETERKENIEGKALDQDGASKDQESKKKKDPNDPQFVPRGRFFLHDDRANDPRSHRRYSPAKKLSV